MPEGNKQVDPVITIIVPCYNGEKFLKDALESISEQSYVNWECLVIDDGSTDNSKDVAGTFISNDKRFKYFYQQNAGPSVARNHGIELARGGYIQFLDADDKLENDKLRKQLEIMDANKDCSIVYGTSAYFNSGEKTLHNSKNVIIPYWQGNISGKGNDLMETLLQGNIMVVHSPLIRKSVFSDAGLFDPDIWFNEDWDVWLRCAMCNLSFIFDDSPNTGALIRMHNENRSKNLFKMYLNGLKVYIKIKKCLSDDRFLRIIKKRIITHLMFLEREIIEWYHISKVESKKKAEKLYSVTGLKRHKWYSELLKNYPFFICVAYQKLLGFMNGLTYAFVYVS